MKTKLERQLKAAGEKAEEEIRQLANNLKIVKEAGEERVRQLLDDFKITKKALREEVKVLKEKNAEIRHLMGRMADAADQHDPQALEGIAGTIRTFLKENPKPVE